MARTNAPLTGDATPLRRWRIEEGLTVQQLADRIDISPSFISDLEWGRKNASLEVAARLVVTTKGALAIADFLSPDLAVQYRRAARRRAA